MLWGSGAGAGGDADEAQRQERALPLEPEARRRPGAPPGGEFHPHLAYLCTVRAELREQLDRAYDRMKFKRSEERQLQVDLEQIHARLSNLDHEREAIGGQLEGLRKHRAGVEGDLDEQVSAPPGPPPVSRSVGDLSVWPMGAVGALFRGARVSK
eukprot:235568-Prorocentrum_minimum.AAC.1